MKKKTRIVKSSQSGIENEKRGDGFRFSTKGQDDTGLLPKQATIGIYNICARNEEPHISSEFGYYRPGGGAKMSGISEKADWNVRISGTALVQLRGKCMGVPSGVGVGPEK